MSQNTLEIFLQCSSMYISYFSLKMTKHFLGKNPALHFFFTLLQEPSTVVSKEILGTHSLNQVAWSLKPDRFPWISTFSDISS